MLVNFQVNLANLQNCAFISFDLAMIFTLSKVERNRQSFPPHKVVLIRQKHKVGLDCSRLSKILAGNISDIEA
jgi:hypothetical protein